MPRYLKQPEYEFTTKDGDKHRMKENREINGYQTALVLNDLAEKTELDEVASRTDVFGDDTEFLSYLLFDHNVVKLIESRFDVSNLKELKIPIVNEI